MSEREEIERLSQHNPIIRAHLITYLRNGVPWPEMLEALVLSLADSNKSLYDQAVAAGLSFRDGAEAMREAIATEMFKYTLGGDISFEAIEVIRGLPIPEPPK